MQPVEELVADGLLERRNGRMRTTRRWQSAMARAALRILTESGDGEDLRVPIVSALFELYGEECPEERVFAYVEAILPIERRELTP
jgi:hypothetical protein